jgi:hypothetical protein
MISACPALDTSPDVLAAGFVAETFGKALTLLAAGAIPIPSIVVGSLVNRGRRKTDRPRLPPSGRLTLPGKVD